MLFRRELEKYNATRDITVLADSLRNVLADQQRPPDQDLPNTGIPLCFERALSSIFVQGPEFDYGTRCSTVICETADGNLLVDELTYRRGENPSEWLNPQEDFACIRFQLKSSLQKKQSMG